MSIRDDLGFSFGSSSGSSSELKAAADLQVQAKDQIAGLLNPCGLDAADLSAQLSRFHQLAPNLDDADLFFQKDISESWSLEDNVIKHTNFSIESGLGVRAMLGEQTGFAYSDVITPAALAQAVEVSSGIAKVGKTLEHKVENGFGVVSEGESKNKLDFILPEQKIILAKSLYPNLDPVNLTDSQKVELLQLINQYVRKQDPRIIEVNISLAASYEQICVARLDGIIGSDVRPLVRLNISVIAKEGDKKEQGFAGGGERSNYEYFVTNDLWKKYADDAVRIALVNLGSVSASAGNMPVVLGPGWPGVLLHEAIGHGLEGDFIRKGTSSFCSQMGEMVASKQCTVVDDGTVQMRRGSLSIDDEGTPTNKTVLIENGKLVNVMKDRQTARLMGEAPTGNGRRESYDCMPMTRMTNTYMLNGKYDPQEIIKTIDNGIYAVNFGGGQVDITSGKFVFVISEGYIVKNGKIKAPIKGATLIGHGPSALKEISMVGNDLELDSGVGVCGKDGQSVPVGVGQPSLKLDKMTVGGAE